MLVVGGIHKDISNLKPRKVDLYRDIHSYLIFRDKHTPKPSFGSPCQFGGQSMTKPGSLARQNNCSKINTSQYTIYIYMNMYVVYIYIYYVYVLYIHICIIYICILIYIYFHKQIYINLTSRYNCYGS